MPNRILREGILTSPRIAKLDWAAEVFYRRLMSVVDDFGRYYADAGMLRAACYPRQLGKVSDSDIGKWLTVLVEAALVRVYPALDGERYLQLLDFRQQARAAKSKFPEPPSECIADATQVPSKGDAAAPVFVFGDVSVSEGVGSGSALGAAPPSPPPAFDGKNAEALNGKAVVPLAAGWELPEQWGLDAEALGFKPSEVIREAEKLRQWATEGKGKGTRRNVKGWRQTWSNWLEKAARDHR
jgi:hypothetical protein